jgi:phage terminase large subunit GpA-like protein
VYPFLQKYSSLNYIAVKGSSVPGSQLFSVPKKTAVRRVKLTMVGTDTAKGLVYSRLKIEDTESNGYCHFPKDRGYDDEFFAQLTSEKVTNKYAFGKKIQVWKKTRERNEALDIRAYNMAAFALAIARYGVRINKLVEACKAQMEELRKEQAEPDEKDEALPVVTDSAAATATPVAPAEPAVEVAKLDEGRPLKAKTNAFTPLKPKRRLMSFSLL